MTTILQRRPRSILRQRLTEDVAGLPIVWGLFVAAVVALSAVVLLVGPDRFDTSAWEQAAQLPRWYAGAVGVYLTAVHLPLYIAHGYTRREFAVGIPAFTFLFAVALALLMTVGYAVEALVYGWLDWSHGLSQTHLFEVPTQYPSVFAEFFLLHLVWTVAGIVLGAAFYRNAGLGLALVPLAVLMVALAQAATGPQNLGPFPSFDAAGSLPLVGGLLAGGSHGVAAAVSGVVVALASPLAWYLVRDLPLRSRPT